MRPIALAAAALLSAASLAAVAKLPPLSEEAKAKAAEAAAKTEHGNKVSAFKLCQAMDKVAAKYGADAKKPAAGKDAGAAAPAAASACTDPGPYVVAAPTQKPIEAAGAHSPTDTATKPPASGAPAAATVPTQAGAAPTAPGSAPKQ